MIDPALNPLMITAQSQEHKQKPCQRKTTQFSDILLTLYQPLNSFKILFVAQGGQLKGKCPLKLEVHSTHWYLNGTQKYEEQDAVMAT